MQTPISSTLSMRRATDTTLENHLNRIISIHALHEESDPLYGANALLPAISIHALHEESDMLRESEAYGPSSFQSTLSMRRATDQGSAAQAASSDFNPRSP